MFTPEEYHKRLNAIGLTQDQKDKLSSMLEEMIDRASSIDFRIKREKNMTTPEANASAHYFEGKADGLNAAFHLVNGSLDERDEFDEQ